MLQAQRNIIHYLLLPQLYPVYIQTPLIMSQMALPGPVQTIKSFCLKETVFFFNNQKEIS